MDVVVRRSALRMWLLAIGAIPLLIISIDVLTNRRITNWLREIVFRPDDTQIFEPRDVIYAWAMLLFASVLILWGLKELFFPTKVVECRDDGLAVRLRGPFRKPDLIRWSNVVDVAGGEIEDEGDVLSLLNIKVLGRAGLPDHPWGARWVEDRVLGLLSQDWSQDPVEVAVGIGDYAVEAARRETRHRTADIWESS
ncbi:MAG: hypothetical protein IH943_03685 [Acidobacteria bacterium]|nr:hypothetical protein [Acidobacteriota bacterium]MCZ6662817.1 hypothetical protein [Actinomycetota bacterium]